MSNKIFQNCNEANICCDKTQYNEASFLEKIKLNIHLILCKACRKYSKQNIKLSKLVKHKKEKLNTLEKNKLKTVLDKEIANQNNK